MIRSLTQKKKNIRTVNDTYSEQFILKIIITFKLKKMVFEFLLHIIKNILKINRSKEVRNFNVMFAIRYENTR